MVCDADLWQEGGFCRPEKRKFHSLKHSIATHLLDARGELKFVQDWVGHKNIQNTTKYAQLTTRGAMRKPGSCLQIIGCIGPAARKL